MTSNVAVEDLLYVDALTLYGIAGWVFRARLLSQDLDQIL